MHSTSLTRQLPKTLRIVCTKSFFIREDCSVRFLNGTCGMTYSAADTHTHNTYYILYTQTIHNWVCAPPICSLSCPALSLPHPPPKNKTLFYIQIPKHTTSLSGCCSSLASRSSKNMFFAVPPKHGAAVGRSEGIAGDQCTS